MRLCHVKSPRGIDDLVCAELLFQLKSRKSNVPLRSAKDCSNIVLFTLPETNIAPENRPPQKESSLPTVNFQGLCLF